MTPSSIQRTVKIIGIPVLAALVLRYLFDIKSWQSLWELMTMTFFLSLPYIVGALTIFLSGLEKVKSLAYRIFFPWVPIMAFFVITLIFEIEGWACWIMLLPLFLLFASLGGVSAGYFKLRKSRTTSNIHLSLAVLLPFFMGPIEKSIGEIPGFYRAYTYIDIDAPKETIWSHVTRVTEISASEDQGQVTNFLQMPRPIKAELDYEGWRQTEGDFRRWTHL